MTYEDYASLNATNWSLLKHLRRSPLHYQAALTAPREDTDSLRLGRAVHTAVFEPNRFALECVVWDGGRRYGKEWDAFERVAKSQGRTILTADQYQRACRIRDAVRGHRLVAPLLAEGQAEHVIQWTSEATGMPLKGRLDWLGRRDGDLLLVDLKTARTATDLRQFANTAYSLGYVHQLSFYASGVRAVYGQDPLPYIVAVEPEAPHDVVLYRVSEDALWAAGEQVGELLQRLKQCRDENQWPGCFDSAQELDLPRWAYPSEDDVGPVADPAWMEG